MRGKAFCSILRNGLIITSFLTCLCACKKANKSEEEEEYKQIIYTQEQVYDYELKDDDRYGKAIYPNEAYRRLKEIKAYNREVGIEWPETGYFSESRDSLSGIGGTPTDYDRHIETYLKDEYFQIAHIEASTAGGSITQTTEKETFYYIDDVFYHETFVSGDSEEPLLVPSSIPEMNAYRSINSIINEQYENFVAVVDSIEKEQFESIIDPQQIKCYINEEEQGTLYININRYQTLSGGTPYRMIYRIVFKNYLPVLAVNNKVTSILVNNDYQSDLKMSKFLYDAEEIRGEIHE